MDQVWLRQTMVFQLGLIGRDLFIFFRGILIIIDF